MLFFQQKEMQDKNKIEKLQQVLKEAEERYEAFLRRHRNTKTLFLELGVGYNTPGIIKYPFWQMTAENRNAVYVCINFGEAVCPKEIVGQSICIDNDIGDVLSALK